MNPELVRYIRENRATYTREAISQRLLDAGHAAADVETAWRVVEEEIAREEVAAGVAPVGALQAPRAAAPARRSMPSSLRSPRFWGVLIAYVIAVYMISGVVAAVTADGPLEGVPGLIVFGLLWVVGLVGAISMRARDRITSSALLAGIIAIIFLPVALAFISIVIIAGICLVLIGAGRGI